MVARRGRPAAGHLGGALRLRAPRRRVFYAARNAAVWMVLRRRWSGAAGAHGGRKVGFFAAPADGMFLRVAASGLWDLPLFHRAAQDSGVNPEPFLQLDRIIHEKGRLAIMSALAATPQLSFTEMRDSLAMTDGNVMANIRTLHEAGYIS